MWSVIGLLEFRAENNFRSLAAHVYRSMNIRNIFEAHVSEDLPEEGFAVYAE